MFQKVQDGDEVVVKVNGQEKGRHGDDASAQRQIDRMRSHNDLKGKARKQRKK